MARPGPLNRYKLDPEYDPQCQGLRDWEDSEYPFTDTRQLHWQNPRITDRYPSQNRGERNGHVERFAAPATASTPATRCRYEAYDLESNQPRGPGAMLGMRNGQMRILQIRPEDRIIKFTILKPKNFKSHHRFLGVFNIISTVLYKPGDTQGYLMLQKTYYAQMEVSQMKTNPMLRRGLGRIKFEAVKAVEIARKFASSSKE